MKRTLAMLGTAMVVGAAGPSAATPPATTASDRLALPPPSAGPTGLDAALRQRRSVRELSSRTLSPARVGQLLWAAQGVTDSSGHRTAPSAGALYPLELYAVDHEGVYRYQPAGHRLEPVRAGDFRAALAGAALGQAVVEHAGLSLVITGTPARLRERYGNRAERFTTLEAGHAAQNVLLEATALGLGAVPVGAFDDQAVARTIGARAGETPLLVLAIGEPQGAGAARR